MPIHFNCVCVCGVCSYLLACLLCNRDWFMASHVLGKYSVTELHISLLHVDQSLISVESFSDIFHSFLIHLNLMGVY